MQFKEFLSKLEGVKRDKNNQYTALCPAHDDHKPSLSVTEKAGKILLHCFAGCNYKAILDELGLEDKDLFLNSKGPTNKNILTTYNYFNAKGNLLFQVCKTSDKQFPQRRPTKSGWGWGLGDTKRVLYNLPEVKKAVKKGHWIFIVEGEKDVDNLNQLGFTATCNPMGAGKWQDSYSETLEGANVIILPDNDDEGRRHALKVARSLEEKAILVKVLELPDLPESGDVSNWINDGRTEEELKRMVKEKTVEGKKWKPDIKETPKRKSESKEVITLQEFQSLVNKRRKAEVDFSIDFSLPPTAYPQEGWLSNFVSYGLSVTDANKELLLAGGLAALSGSVGKLIAMPHFGARNLYPNLWVCTLAPHGRHRKSTVISLVRSFLQKVGMWNILPDEVTPEKLISEMQSHNATGTFAMNEMASFLALANRSYQGGFKPMLANWYDVPTQYTKKKMTGTEAEKELIIKEPYITIFGGSTLEWFLEATDPTDVLGGLFSRMIFIPLTEKKREKVLWPDQLSGRETMPENELASDLRRRINYLQELTGNGEPVIFNVSPKTKARHIYYRWTRSMDKEVEDSAEINKIGGFAERLQTVAKKIALLVELARPEFTDILKDKIEVNKDQVIIEIAPESIELSVSFVNEAWRVTKLLVERRFVHDPFARMFQKTLEIVYENGKIQRSTLLRKLHVRARDLNELQKTLKDAGYIDIVKVRHEGSDKPTEYFVPTN